MKSEIILYRPNETAEHIEVRLEDETVWLSQQQMATLFNQTKQNVSLHINNCYREGELERESTVKESLTVQKEGSRRVKRKIDYYNLDVIISVGYRVRSKEGTQFRIWATGVLKDYLLKGNQMKVGFKKANEQYGNFEVEPFIHSHDRFLIVDEKEVYHLGASLKDLGKKWFAFSKLEKKSVQNITNTISELI